MCRAKGTFSACLGPRCSLARRGSARFSECAPYDHLSLSLSHARARALFFSFSPAYHGFSIPLFLSSSLPCPSSFYSLVNAPFVNRPRVGFRKIPIADRLGSETKDFDWRADDPKENDLSAFFFWFFIPLDNDDTIVMFRFVVSFFESESILIRFFFFVILESLFSLGEI